MSRFFNVFLAAAILVVLFVDSGLGARLGQSTTTVAIGPEGGSVDSMVSVNGSEYGLGGGIDSDPRHVSQSGPTFMVVVDTRATATATADAKAKADSEAGPDPNLGTAAEEQGGH